MSKNTEAAIYICKNCLDEFAVNPKDTPKCPKCGSTDVYVKEW